MDEIPTRKAITIYLQLDKVFRLDRINKIKDNFIAEILERKTTSKTLSKFITPFDYVDKTLLVLYATIGGVSIVSFATGTGAAVKITRASLV